MSWHCPGCGGVALSVALLRDDYDGSFVNELWQRARAAPALDWGKTCPMCSKFMREISVPAGDTAIALDVCLTCEFVWLDGAEVDAIPRASS